MIGDYTFKYLTNVWIENPTVRILIAPWKSSFPRENDIFGLIPFNHN